MKGSVRETIREEIPDMANDIVSKGIIGINYRIGKLETENKRLEKDFKKLKVENKLLETIGDKLKKVVDAGDQYGRRNSLRMSGIPATELENTDRIVLDVARAIGVNLDINEIDHSNRVRQQKDGKHRDMIIKFATYRARQKANANRTMN